MAKIGFKKSFQASHGTKIVRDTQFHVVATMTGPIVNDFVKGADYDIARHIFLTEIGKLELQYLDDIVGRGTTENVARYLMFNLQKYSFEALRVWEEDAVYVEVAQADVDSAVYPSELLYSLAKSKLNREKPQAAEQDLTSLLNGNPPKKLVSRAYNLRGRCAKYQDRWADAKKDFLRAIAVDKSFADAYRNLGNAYLYLNQTRLMIPAFNRAVNLSPTSALAYTNRGFAFQQLNQWCLALADQMIAISLDPNYEEAHRDLALSHARLNDSASSLKHLAIADELKSTGRGTYAGLKMYCGVDE